MKVDLDDISSDDDLQFTTGLGFKKKQLSKEEQIYGDFLRELDSDTQKQNKKYQDSYFKPQLNLFQEDFEQTPKKQPQPNQQQSHDRLKQVHKEYMKNQAFGNFKRSDASLLSNVEKGVTVKICDDQQVKQPAQNKSEYKVKLNKSVQFNLDNNNIHPIQKSEEEYLTYEEKWALSTRIRMQRICRPMMSSDEEDDEREEQYEYVEILAQPSLIKGILKKEPKIFQEEEDDGKKTITVESVQFREKNKKSVSQKEKKNLEKKVEDHDYGIGLKFLKKFGFQYGQGLGANKQGILEPVLAVRKKAFTGEGEEREMEIEENIEEETKDNKLEEPFFQSKKLSKYEKQWRKKKKSADSQNNGIQEKKEEVVILDRNHIMDSLKQQAASQFQYKIIDMTNGEGNDYLNNNNQNGMESENKKSVKEYLKIVQELTWSVQNLLEKKLSKWENNEQNILKEKDKIIIIEHQKQEEMLLLSKSNDSLNKRQQFLQYLTFLQNNDILISDDQFPIFSKFEECFQKYTDQFIQFNLIGLLIKKAEANIKGMIGSWQGPQNDGMILLDEFHLIKKIVLLAKEVFIQKKSQNLSKYAEELDVLIINNSISTADIRILQRYIGILITPILTKLRNFIASTYNPSIKNNLLEFLELWSSSIALLETDEAGENQFQQLKLFDEQVQKDILQIVIPKMRLQISQWIPESQLHEWLVPWVKSKLNTSELMAEVEMKLKSFKFSEKEDFGYSTLHPWSKLLGEKWNSLILKSVIPKMLFSLSNIEINPQNQNIQPIKAALKWSDDIEQYIEMIFQSVIEKLGKTLDHWISVKGSREEMENWLKGWEKLLRNKVLSKVYKFEAQFNSMRNKIQVN